MDILTVEELREIKRCIAQRRELSFQTLERLVYTLEEAQKPSEGAKAYDALLQDIKERFWQTKPILPIEEALAGGTKIALPEGMVMEGWASKWLPPKVWPTDFADTMAGAEAAAEPPHRSVDRLFLQRNRWIRSYDHK